MKYEATQNIAEVYGTFKLIYLTVDATSVLVVKVSVSIQP